MHHMRSVWTRDRSAPSTKGGRPRPPRGSRRAVTSLVLAAAALGGIASITVPASASRPGPAPIVAEPVSGVAYGSSKGDLRRLAPMSVVRREEIPRPKDPPSTSTGLSAVDPVTRGPAAGSVTPSTSTSFDGLRFSQGGCGWPPDTSGDVSATHYVQAVNCAVGIFDKSGTLLANPTLNAFFGAGATGTPCDNSNQGDPVVLHDSFANRWLVSDFAWSSSSGPYYQCFAVSKSADPVAGGWNFFAMNVGSYLGDYPKLGIWGDGVYMSANMFSPTGSFKYAQVWAIRRSALEAAIPSFSAFTVKLPASIRGIPLFSLLPSNAKAATGSPPAGRPNYFASIWGSYQLRVWKFAVNSSWTSAALSGPTDVPIATFNPGPSNVPELNGNNIDTLSYRLMMQNQYTNLNGVESLWLTHTVGSGGTPNLARVRWYQLPVTGNTVASAPAQQSTYAPADSVHRFMPSLAVDQRGAMAVGYTPSNASMFPGIRYAARCAADALGTLGQEVTMLNGGGAATKYGRWGDYSSMTLDPDGRTFWYTTEYYASTNDYWSTRIGHFTVGC